MIRRSLYSFSFGVRLLGDFRAPLRKKNVAKLLGILALHRCRWGYLVLSTEFVNLISNLSSGGGMFYADFLWI